MYRKNVTYFLWSEINRRMRDQKKKFPSCTRETFLSLLRRAALGLLSSVVSAAVGDMRRRCSRLLAAAGGNIEEGGRA